MIEKILIEKHLINNPIAKNILGYFSKSEVIEIESMDQIFGKFKKPYLEKRENLNLFIAEKRGSLIKEAPNAYGLSGAPHYYFVHAYNCIYECTYCYLQGYFDSPDLVLFVNHEDITKAISLKIEEHEKMSNRNQSGKDIWFHAGEFSDSLALSHITKEIPLYFEIFKKYPYAFLELRTKSANTKILESLSPLPNVITSFSLAPHDNTKKYDLKTPTLKHRLLAMKRLKDLGHPIAVHLDPIIYSENIIQKYESLIETLKEEINFQNIEYISVGVVRFTKEVFHQVKQNYPDSDYFHSELTKGEDGKIRYPRPIRMWILNRIKGLLIAAGASEKQVYLCMEDSESIKEEV